MFFLKGCDDSEKIARDNQKRSHAFEKLAHVLEEFQRYIVIRIHQAEIKSEVPFHGNGEFIMNGDHHSDKLKFTLTWLPGDSEEYCDLANRKMKAELETGTESKLVDSESSGVKFVYSDNDCLDKIIYFASSSETSDFQIPLKSKERYRKAELLGNKTKVLYACHYNIGERGFIRINGKDRLLERAHGGLLNVNNNSLFYHCNSKNEESTIEFNDVSISRCASSINWAKSNQQQFAGIKINGSLIEIRDASKYDCSEDSNHMIFVSDLYKMTYPTSLPFEETKRTLTNVIEGTKTKTNL